MQEQTATIPKISCGHCTRTIENELEQIEGVESVSASAATKQVVVRFGPPASWEKIAGALREIGYPPE